MTGIVNSTGTKSGVIGTTVGTVTLAKMAGGTDGNLITYDTSGDPAYVATGTSGHVLTSAGADAVPSFATIAGTGSTFHKQINGSDSTQTFYTDDSIFMGSYLVSASSTQTITTPTNFTANDCILMGGRRSVTDAANIVTQYLVNEFNVCNFTAANTISLVNSSGYTVYIYFCCIRFK